ncbi:MULTISPECIES: VOC family protein [Paenibacillus]|uniref:VOC family protein n=1 Tax=Paenibacillus TaxID=44249 RepID=UPI001F0FCCA5|nr:MULTISPECIES: VOC family protein [Paenibacillus]
MIAQMDLFVSRRHANRIKNEWELIFYMTEQMMDTPQHEIDRLDKAGIPPMQLHHIGFKTARFLEMRAFYRTFLGVTPSLEVEGIGGFYTFDLAHHRLVLFHDPACIEQVPASAGMHHVAFIYSIDDLMRTYQRLKHKGLLPYMAMNHGPNTSFYYRDPDNNALELQVDNYGPDLLKGLEAMRALQQCSNPVEALGVMVNPETFLKAWQEGATLTELHERSYAGEFAEGTPSIPI